MAASQNNRRLLWDVVFGICIIVTVLATVIKLYSGDVKFSVDFPTLLSLLLALFSVALSALFYFKATESSNSFYDNTYRFTTDISQLLARMDTGLGEKLKLLENRYSDLKDYMRSGYAPNGTSESKATSEQIDQEKAELERVVSEKDIIIARLIENSSLDDAEKSEIRKELEEKNNKIKELLDEVETLRGRQNWEQASEAAIFRFDDDMDEDGKVPMRVVRYTKDVALRRLGAEPDDLISYRRFASLFSRGYKELTAAYLIDLEELGFYSNGRLTRKGYDFFVQVAL